MKITSVRARTLGDPLIWEVLHGEPEPVDGTIEIRDGPGFGWTINEENMERYALR